MWLVLGFQLQCLAEALEVKASLVLTTINLVAACSGFDCYFNTVSSRGKTGNNEGSIARYVE